MDVESTKGVDWISYATYVSQVQIHSIHSAFVMLGLDSANRVSLPVAFCYSVTKGALQRLQSWRRKEKGERNSSPLFVFLVNLGCCQYHRASFLQSGRGVILIEAIELVCRFSSLCRIRFNCVPLRHQQLSLSIPSEKSESLLCGDPSPNSDTWSGKEHLFLQRSEYQLHGDPCSSSNFNGSRNLFLCSPCCPFPRGGSW